MRSLKGVGELVGCMLTAYFAVNIGCLLFWIMYRLIHAGLLCFADFLGWLATVLS